VRLVLLGPPGAGKGTQARLLEAKLHVPQIASGDLLRTAVRDQTALGIQAKSFMDKGGLVPDELVLGMIAERLDRPDAHRGFILDGFPRNVAQAEALGSILNRRNEALDKVVAITLPEDEIVKRISGRRTCRSCGSMYHVVFEPPRNDNTCDKCGAELYQREDDAEQTVRARLRVYATETRPLLDYYGRCGLLARIDGLARPEQIEHRILCAMGVN
jgi:adenylate kinase